MADFVNTQNTGNLIEIIKAIPTRGIPPKFSIEYLSSLGYTSSNDRPIANVFKFIGLVNSNGTPTEYYQKMRHQAESGIVLAAMIRQAYSDLFALYPNAHKEDDNTLKNYFASKTTVGEASLRNIIKTFQALCSCANFEAYSQAEPKQEISSVMSSQELSQPVNVPSAPLRGTEIHFDIQIHIPENQAPEVYEAIFKNLGKYVLGIKDE